MNKTNQIFFLSASLLFMGCSAVNNKGKEADGVNKDSLVFVAGSYSPQNEEGIKVFTFAQDDAGWACKGGITGISNPSFLSEPAAGNIIYSVAEGGDGDSYIYALKYSPDRMTPAMAGHDRTLGSAPCFVMADAKRGGGFHGELFRRKPDGVRCGRQRTKAYVFSSGREACICDNGAER